MAFEKCPNCGKKSLTTLKSSIRKVCDSCGWSDKPAQKEVLQPLQNNKELSNAVFWGLIKFFGVVVLFIVTINIIYQSNRESIANRDPVTQKLEATINGLEQLDREQEIKEKVANKLISHFSITDAVFKKDDLYTKGEIVSKNTDNNSLKVRWKDWDFTLDEDPQNLLIINPNTSEIIWKPPLKEVTEEATKEVDKAKRKEQEIEERYARIRGKMLKNFSVGTTVTKKEDTSLKGRVIETLEVLGDVRVQWENSLVITYEKPEKLMTLDATTGKILWQPPPPKRAWWEWKN